jgi:hypothetical protein
MAPSVVVSESGNVLLIQRYADIDDYEALTRYVSVLSGAHAAVIDTPLTKQTASTVIIKDTISRSITLGRAVKQAQIEHRNPIEAVKENVKGSVLFDGYVDDYEWRDEKGFLFGDVTLTGQSEFRNHKFRTWIKNEYIFAWRDEQPLVMPPDLIMFLNDRGYGVTTDALRSGLHVTVMAARAPEIWRSPRGLQLFGPRHFGFEYDYVPLEELIER